MEKDKIFWLEGFEGKAKSGAYVRDALAINVAKWEKQWNIKIVGLGLEIDPEHGKPSWNLNLITEEK